MTNHAHHHQHHHRPGLSHPPAVVATSILRLSLAERLAAAGLFIAVIWAGVWWAMA